MLLNFFSWFLRPGDTCNSSALLQAIRDKTKSMIRARSVLLHRELLDKLLLHCQKSGTPTSRLANAVYDCQESIQKLYVLLEDGFQNIEEEITFFKSIKPLFVSEREYHQRQYHAHIFGSEDISFWEHEQLRMQKLLDSAKEFSDYYKNGHTHFDFAWFVQGQAPLPTPLCMQPWETNPKNTSARDGWVAGLLAVERYQSWLQAKIKNKQYS